MMSFLSIPHKKRTFVATVVLVSGILALPTFQALLPAYGEEVGGIYFALAFGTAFFIAAWTRCPHCHRRFAANYVFGRMVILLWAARDTCPFCHKAV
jgi:hypothetical protein